MKRLLPWSIKARLGLLVLAGITLASIFLAVLRPGHEARDEGDRPDNPEGLLRERWKMLTAGDSTVTGQALIVAKNQLLAMAEEAAQQSGVIGPQDAGLSSWEWLGPQNIGGRTFAILFDPNNSSHLWAGAETGGISTSSDGGATWSIVDDFLPALSVNCLAIDPTTGFLFAGTGGLFDAGIFRSTDGGTTWTQLASTTNFFTVRRIVAVPADGLIFAATWNGLFRSSDAGATWTWVLTQQSLRDVEATPSSHLVLVGQFGGAFRSTNSGATWDTLTTGGPGLLPVISGRCEFAIAADQLTCYASINRNGGEVWRSLDGGATWNLRRSGDQYLGEQGNFANAIWVDPTNANTVVVGGLDTWRSTDGGLNFLPLSDWQQYPGASAHADHHVIVSPPNYDGVTRRSVYFGNDGGIQRKDDILAGPNDWTDLSNGLKSSQFYKGAVQRIGTEIMGGLQDNGTWRYSGNINWDREYGGDGGYCSYDASESNLYWEYINLRMYKEFFGLPVTCINGLTDANNKCTSLFIAPFKADPVTPGRLFAGGSSIWLTTDYAEHWQSVRGLVNPSMDKECGTVGSLCSAIELVATNSSLVWVGYVDGTVSRSTNGGTIWTDVDAGSTPLPDRFVTDIAVNPANTSEVYVTFGGFHSDNVWFTSNAGTTWTNRSGSGSTALPTAPVETITVHPANSAWIYAGTAVGVLASEDRGLTWGVTRRYPQSEGPAYTEVSDLIWQGNKLVAFTYGRGVWRSGPIAGTSSAPAFTNLGTSLPGVNAGSCDWGDYDNDGDLDILWTGRPTSPDNAGPGEPITRIGRNDGGGNFAVVNAFFPGVVDGAARWGDYDRDSDLDFVITGTLLAGGPIARLYRNIGGGGFSIVSASLEPVYASDEAWGDFDNDGDLDLVISGHTAGNSSNTGSTILYRNDGGLLVNGGSLDPLWHSSVAWGDFDNDGDLDLLVAGRLGNTYNPGTQLYRNDGGTLTNITSGLPNVDESARWGDYDSDGDLDMLLLGGNGLYIHRNNGNGTFLTAATLAGQVDGAAAFGDYDSDGDLDIAVSGKDGLSNATRLHRNNNGTFVDTGVLWNGARKSALAWGDSDNDGDLDLFLSGWANVASVAQIYRNDSATANSAPSAPGGLSVTTGACSPGGVPVTFSWTPGFDDHTSELGYNLRVGTSPGAGNVVSAMSSSSTGFRRVAALGNAQMRRSWMLTLPVGIYYWSVQAIDGSYKASAFASEATTAISNTFNDAAVALQPIVKAACWGDFDGDDEMDLLLTGSASSTVYRNNGGVFSDVSAGLPGVDYSAAAWGDYDNDGDLDIVFTGCNSEGYITRIYRNDSGAFVDIGAGLTGVCSAALAWGDCDNDGDLDLLVAGFTEVGIASTVYANNGGIFSDIGAGLAGVYFGSAAWADYDNDGDLDLLLTGLDGFAPHTDLYRNGGNGDLVLVPSGLSPVYLGNVAWDDCDSDGDVDLLLTGRIDGSPTPIARVYRNDGTGVLTDIVAGLAGVEEGSGNWGDVNNDGRLDLLLTGYNPTIGLLSKVYLGTPANGFIEAASGLQGVYESAADLGDYDGDGDLDVVLAGRTGVSLARIYRSCGASPNASPNIVSGLTAVRNGDRVTFSWSAAADDHSPTGSGLSYNLRVGTTPGGNDVLAPMSNNGSGFRRVPRPGNAQHRLSRTLTLPERRYFWSVQAVDVAYRGGAFAAEKSIGVALVQSSTLPGLYRGAVAWGDYNNDGNLDLLMAGSDGAGPRTYLYKNSGGDFEDIGAGLPDVEWCSLDWGDFDNDGDLDIVMCGWNGGPLITRIYRNDAGTFNDIGAGLPGVLAGTVRWGDYDRDGNLDLLVAGDDGTNHITRIYRNVAGTFDRKADLIGVAYSSAEWADYDADGDLDLVVSGHDGTDGVTRLYRNDDGSFVDSGVSLPDMWEGSVSWGDFEQDGDLDLLITGWTGAIRLCRVYENTGGTFTDVAGLEGISSGRGAWGDYDNDGDLDIVASGYSDVGGSTRVYRKDQGGFVDAGFNLPGLYYSAVGWGDYDNDRDLDLILTGFGGAADVYRNDGALLNLAPNPPGNLTSIESPTQLTLSWTSATDDHTNPSALTYNVRVGTTHGGDQILSAMSAAGDGSRRVVGLGNAQQRLSLTLTAPIPTTFYWSVQAIDGAFIGSSFAAEMPSVSGVATAVAPRVDVLGPAMPNPVSGASQISLALSHAGPVEVDVFDISGHHVATLFRGNMDAGFASIRWRSHGDNGEPIAAGIYLVRMKTQESVQTLKLVVMR